MTDSHDLREAQAYLLLAANALERGEPERAATMLKEIRNTLDRTIVELESRVS